jgi:formate/nitrite transporter
MISPRLIISILLVGIVPTATWAAQQPRTVVPRSSAALTVNGGGGSKAAPPADFSMILSPSDTYQVLVAKGVSNTEISTIKTLTAAVMGGAYVGVGGMLSLAVCGNMPGITSSNPGLVKFTFAALFPVALFLCLQAGAQLFTGNTATMGAAYFEDKITLKDVLRSWILAYSGNMVGCGLFALACSYTGVLAGGSGEMAAKMVVSKTSGEFGPTLAKGILCNWLVCLAVFCAAQAKDIAGKYIGMILPISAFVAIGFEHSVANMFLLPAGMLSKADVDIKTILLKNLLPVTLGNTLAGALLVGAGFSWQFGKLGEGK